MVDLATGKHASPRIRLKTPQPATPEAIVAVIGEIVDRLTADGHVTPGIPAGAGLPGVIKNGRLMTAANIDKRWVNAPATQMIAERIGHPVVLVNDADAAGLAEVQFGAAKDVPGTVLMLTIGTGIGSALFSDGHLLGSTEFGHVTYHGRDAETLVSGAARERRKLGWRVWARDFSEYVGLLERWFWPDLIILGGGVSKEYAKYSKWLKSRAPIVTAQYLNTSGIVGAALAGAGAGQAAALAARENRRALATADASGDDSAAAEASDDAGDHEGRGHHHHGGHDDQDVEHAAPFATPSHEPERAEPDSAS